MASRVNSYFRNIVHVFPNTFHDATTTRAIKMLYAYSACLAIVPLNIHTFRRSWTGSVLCIGMFFVDGYFAYQYIEETFFESNVGKMLAFLVPKTFRSIETFLQMVIYMIIIITHLFDNNHLKGILKNIEKIDKRLAGVPDFDTSGMDGKLLHKIHMFFVLFFILSFLAMAFRHLTATPYSATSIFGFFLPHFQPYVITIQFITFVDIQSNRFERINLYVKQFKLKFKNKAISSVTKNQMKHNLQILACVHNDLCVACHDVNAYFNIQILLAVACHFLSISVAAYTFLSSLGLFFQSDLFTFSNMVFLVLHSSLWVIQRFVILVLTAQTTIRAESLAYDTHQISHKLLIKEHVPQLTKELELFTANVENHGIEFSACGFFPIDYSMIYMIIGAATTYWVILIQIQTSAFTPINNSTTQTTLTTIVTNIPNLTSSAVTLKKIILEN